MYIYVAVKLALILCRNKIFYCFIIFKKMAEKCLEISFFFCLFCFLFVIVCVLSLQFCVPNGLFTAHVHVNTHPSFLKHLNTGVYYINDSLI